MNKVFDMASMACEHVQAWVGSCKFGTGSDASFTPATVDDGSFVVLGGLADDATYTGLKDYNVYYAYAPTAATLTREDVVVIDLAEVAGSTTSAGYVKFGAKTVDLTAEANLPVRFRRIFKGDKFWLGEGNFGSAPTVGKYAKLTANATTLTAADTAPDTGLALAIRTSKPLIQGTLANYSTNHYVQAYLVEVL